MGDPYNWEPVPNAEGITGPDVVSGIVFNGTDWFARVFTDSSVAWYRASDPSFSDAVQIYPESPVAWRSDAEWADNLSVGFLHDRFWTTDYNFGGTYSYPADSPGTVPPLVIYPQPFYSFDLVTWTPAMPEGVDDDLLTARTTNAYGSIQTFKKLNCSGQPQYHAESGRWWFAADSDGDDEVFIVSTDDFSQPWDLVIAVADGDDEVLSENPGDRTVSAAFTTDGEIVVIYSLYDSPVALDGVTRHIAFGSSPLDSHWDTERMWYLAGDGETFFSVVPGWPASLPGDSGRDVIGVGNGEWLGRNNGTYYRNKSARATGDWEEITLPGGDDPFLSPGYYGIMFGGVPVQPVDGMWVWSVNDSYSFLGLLVGPSLAQLELLSPTEIGLPPSDLPYSEGYVDAYASVGGGEWLLSIYYYDDEDGADSQLFLAVDSGGWGIALA